MTRRQPVIHSSSKVIQHFAPYAESHVQAYVHYFHKTSTGSVVHILSTCNQFHTYSIHRVVYMIMRNVLDILKSKQTNKNSNKTCLPHTHTYARTHPPTHPHTHTNGKVGGLRLQSPPLLPATLFQVILSPTQAVVVLNPFT